MKITDRLKVEHGVFLLQLDVLEKLLDDEAPLPVLKAVVETIAAAEERHAQVEERVLWPAVERALGIQFPPLVESRQAHARLSALVESIRKGDFDGALVLQLVVRMREHLEDEIHGAFRVIDDLLTDEQLNGLDEWDAEHVYATAGKWDAWRERWAE